ncbi:MAG TPA: ABC transporter substrate binding protein [Rhabdochlamydiaceae bacterium]|nr:ABC transporter substrate binding protein [Rhabdochlamydiaceae bacterium]
MKYLILVVVLICLATIGLLTFKGENCKIAILTPMTHPSFEQIEKGFVDTMEKHCRQKFTIKTYNALGNKTLMQSKAEEIALGGYDLVFTIATQATHTMKEVYEKKKLATPIVFSASEVASGSQLTGIKETTALTSADRRVYGEEAAEKALLILDEYMLPRDIPITTLPSE